MNHCDKVSCGPVFSKKSGKWNNIILFQNTANIFKFAVCCWRFNVKLLENFLVIDNADSSKIHRDCILFAIPRNSRQCAWKNILHNFIVCQIKKVAFFSIFLDARIRLHLNNIRQFVLCSTSGH